jgi:hypothetical protein
MDPHAGSQPHAFATDDNLSTVELLVLLEGCMVSGVSGNGYNESYDLGDFVTNREFCRMTSTNRFR